MKTNRFAALLMGLVLLGRVSSLGQTNPILQPIISTEQLAAAFGYSGELKIQDFASLGLTKPNVLQELNFTSDDSTFLPTNVTVLSAGSDLNPQQRAAFQKTANLSPAPPNFKAVTLPDGTTAYLLSMGGPGGSGGEAHLTSKDGRFDLAISFTAIAEKTYERNASNQSYYEKMLGDKSDPLTGLAEALPQIYSAVASNYEKIVAEKSGTNASSPTSTQILTTNSSSSQTSTSSSASVPPVPLVPATAISTSESSVHLWIYGIIVLSVGLALCIWYFLRARK